MNRDTFILAGIAGIILMLIIRAATPIIPGSNVRGIGASNPDSLLPSGMIHRWKASDLSSTPVATWTDSIGGFNWTAAGAAQPAWDTNGVSFNGTDDRMTATNLTTYANTTDKNAYLAVFTLNSTADAHMLMGNTFAANNIFYAVTPAATFYEGGGDTISVSTLPTDLLVCNTTNALTSYRYYTNGLLAKASATGAWNDAAPINRVGGSTTGHFINAVLREFIIWTNVTFTASQIADIHSYCTNVYQDITP